MKKHAKEIIAATLKPIIKTLPFLRKPARALLFLRRNGIKRTIKRIFSARNPLSLKRYTCSKKEYIQQTETVFSNPVKISIAVPLYNTPLVFLTDMLNSLKEQTYPHFELCLADGSDDAHGDVKALCDQYSQDDGRIKYKKLQKNEGISQNTNAALQMATGDYIGLLDHDDILHPSALYEVVKAINEEKADFIYTDEISFADSLKKLLNPHFKPDFAPDNLRANNYICHFTVFSAKLYNEVGGFRKECDGSQDFDMVLRLTEKAQKIVHIPKVLYFWRAHAGSVASSVTAKPYVIDAAKRAISEHLERVGLKGEVLDSMVPSMYRIKYTLNENPLVSIIIPTKDHTEDLAKCLNSVFALTTYAHYEIIIVENNSVEKETFNYYKKIEKDERVKIITWKDTFNYSAINNFGAEQAKGEYLVLLNNDVEVITPDWLQEMLMYAQREDVGIVGAKLYYPDNTIQHAGIGIGLLTLAGHYHKEFDRNHPGYMGRLIYAQNVSAVTGACMMISKKLFDTLGGLDAKYQVAFNDVDLCMRVRQKGYLIVFTPFAELYHYESKSRGKDEAPEARARFVSEVLRFQQQWKETLAAGDPYYNPNFSLEREDFTIAPVAREKVAAD
jgi:Predicted glycosyltransferases